MHLLSLLRHIFKNLAALRVIGIGTTVGGILFGGLVIIIGYMVFNGRIVNKVVPIITPAPIQPKISVDNRSPKQRTRIPDTRLHCTPNPAGLTLTAQIKPLNIISSSPVSETIQLEGTGFLPDETLDIFLKSTWHDGLYNLAFNEQVSRDGTFARLEQVTWDKPQSEWQVFVVHQRGAACVKFLGN